MSDQAWKEADSLTANCTHGLEFAETGEHYADLRTRIRACIAYQIVERDRARQNDHATALAAVAAEREKWAAFADEKGEPRKVLGTLPVTADGCVIGHGARIHGFWNDGKPGWTGFSAVRVDTDDWDRPQCGKFYSTKEAAESALAAQTTTDAGVKP